jgi:hypothetical protein
MSGLLTRWTTKATALLGLIISTVGMLPSVTAYCIDRLRRDPRGGDWEYVFGELTGKFTYSYAAQGSVSFRTNGMQGGDAGHGGYLDVEIDTKGRATDLYVSIDGKESKQVSTVTLTWRGDNEMQGAGEGFAFLARNLTFRTLDRERLYH